MTKTIGKTPKTLETTMGLQTIKTTIGTTTIGHETIRTTRILGPRLTT